MAKEAVFTMKLELELREYDEFLSRKVDAARVSRRAGLGLPNEDIESLFDARRATIEAQA